MLYTEFQRHSCMAAQIRHKSLAVENLHNYCKSLIFFRFLLNNTEIYFNKVSIHFSDSTQVTYRSKQVFPLCSVVINAKLLLMQNYVFKSLPSILNKRKK